MSESVSVILPTYNEKENVRIVINEIIQHVVSLKEIIVVDDDSPDKTWEVVERLAQSNNKIKLIRRVNERGLVSAIRAGIINAKGEYIGWMDCDMGMPPALINKLLKELDNCDIAVGSRYVANGRDLRGFFRRFTSYAINKFAGVVLRLDIKDLTSGFIVCKRSVFDKIKLYGNYGEYCINFLCEAVRLGYIVREVPYTFRDRTAGKSKSSFFSFGIGYVTAVLKLYRRLI